jgi:hypothetical protein
MTALGFSVEALLPSARVSGPLRMGLVRLPDSGWLDPAPDLAARNAAFDAHPDSVAVLPEAAPAIAELAAMWKVADGKLETCARSVWEDLCVMVQDAPGRSFRLCAAAVAFPTDWRIAEKMGRAVHEVHQPIHDYAEQLASPVDRFMDGLRPGSVFGRTNAFVVASGDLRYMPTLPPSERFTDVTPENASETLFVRCERETLIRLPQSGAILFTIGIYRTPLGRLSDGAVARIAQSLHGYPEDELERRSGPHYAAALAAYVERRKQARAA